VGELGISSLITRGIAMKESDVRARAFAMPLTSPAFPPGPYRFRQREYLIIAYRTNPDRLRALVPEPLEVDKPVVKYEFIRMPDSTGFGDYTETGQVVRCPSAAARAAIRIVCS
jgi:acetoacetate decarboxylase